MVDKSLLAHRPKWRGSRLGSSIIMLLANSQTIGAGCGRSGHSFDTRLETGVSRFPGPRSSPMMDTLAGRRDGLTPQPPWQQLAFLPKTDHIRLAAFLGIFCLSPDSFFGSLVCSQRDRDACHILPTALAAPAKISQIHQTDMEDNGRTIYCQYIYSQDTHATAW